MNFKQEFLKIKFIQDLNHPQEIVMTEENMNKITEVHDRVLDSILESLKIMLRHNKIKYADESLSQKEVEHIFKRYK